MDVSLVTTCGDRLAHLALTLPAMCEAATEAADVLGVEVVVVDYGPTPGVRELIEANPIARRVVVESDTWNFGRARNAGLDAAAGTIYVNVDCDTFIDSGSIETVADWFDIQPESFFIRSAYARGMHGRMAFYTSELRALGGFDAEGIDGMAHVLGVDIEDVVNRALDVGFCWKTWPTKYRIIDHEIDMQEANIHGGEMVLRVRRKREARRLEMAENMPTRRERNRARRSRRRGE